MRWSKVVAAFCSHYHTDPERVLAMPYYRFLALFRAASLHVDEEAVSQVERVSAAEAAIARAHALRDENARLRAERAGLRVVS